MQKPQSNTPRSYYMKRLQQECPEIHDALHLMRQYSPLGKRLVEWVEETQIPIIEKKLDTWGEYDLTGNIHINPDNTLDLNISILAHEIMHAVQGSRGRIIASPHWDAVAMILNNRSLEAAAQTCAIKVCYEMKQNGHAAAFDHVLEQNSAYTTLFQVFERSYLSAEENGETHHAAMQSACDDCFHAYFKNQPIIDVYNDILLQQYTEMLMNGTTSNIQPATWFSEQDARDLTEIADDEYLVTQVMPDTSDYGLYGENKRIRQAFEYVEYVRHLNVMGGENNFGVRRHMQELQKDNNPYMAVNLNTVLQRFEARKTDTDTPDFLEIMNAAAGIASEKQISLGFSDAAKPKELLPVSSQRGKVKTQRRTR